MASTSEYTMKSCCVATEPRSRKSDRPDEAMIASQRPVCDPRSTPAWHDVWKSFRQNKAGGIATVFALSLPFTVSAVALTIDLATIASSRASLQTIADQAALMGAREMHLRQEREAVLANAVEAFATSMITEIVDASVTEGMQPSVTVSVNLDEGTTHVVVTAKRRLVLADKLKPSVGMVTAEAEARAVGDSAPLCLVTLAPSENHKMHFMSRSRISAPGCVAYSNSGHPNGVFFQEPDLVEFNTVCSAGGIQNAGHFTFSGEMKEDCPTLNDPLSSRVLPGAEQNCDHNNLIKLNPLLFPLPLHPGTYCGITILHGRFEMSPGTYIFQDGRLYVGGLTHLRGQDVHLHFSGTAPGNGVVLVLGERTTINLWAPRHGPAAGLLITGDRESPKTQRYQILSDNANVLEGTIYVPQGKVEIGSSQPISRDANYTIVVAKEFELAPGPAMTMDINVASFQFNTDYHLSDVPVPPGLGPTSHLSTAQVRLTR